MWSCLWLQNISHRCSLNNALPDQEVVWFALKLLPSAANGPKIVFAKSRKADLLIWTILVNSRWARKWFRHRHQRTVVLSLFHKSFRKSRDIIVYFCCCFAVEWHIHRCWSRNGPTPVLKSFCAIQFGGSLFGIFISITINDRLRGSDSTTKFRWNWAQNQKWILQSFRLNRCVWNWVQDVN